MFTLKSLTSLLWHTDGSAVEGFIVEVKQHIKRKQSGANQWNKKCSVKGHHLIKRPVRNILVDKVLPLRSLDYVTSSLIEPFSWKKYVAMQQWWTVCWYPSWADLGAIQCSHHQSVGKLVCTHSSQKENILYYWTIERGLKHSKCEAVSIDDMQSFLKSPPTIQCILRCSRAVGCSSTQSYLVPGFS